MTDASTPRGEAASDAPSAASPFSPRPLPQVRDHAGDGDVVELIVMGNRLAIQAWTQSGHDFTAVDLADLLRALGLETAAQEAERQAGIALLGNQTRLIPNSAEFNAGR